jgi:hypothetical protein
MPLEGLNCSFNPITSIEALLGMPLKSLDLEGCDNLRDISSLSQLRDLEHIKIPKHIDNTEFIEKLPRLKNPPASIK